MLRGQWDFAWTLLGLSGFLLLGGVLLLSAIDSAWRSFFAAGKFNPIAWDNDSSSWLFFSTGYVIFLVGMVLVLLRSRRHTTVIYHLSQQKFDHIFQSILQARGFSTTVGPTGYRIATPVGGEPSSSVSQTMFDLEVDFFPAMNHLTLRWKGVAPLEREGLEKELVREFARARHSEEGRGSWFTTAASFLFIILLINMLLLIVALWTNPQLI